MKQILVAFIFGIAILAVPKAQAANIPAFPSCNAPQGSIISHYDSGTHGIVGNTETFTGSDTVYKVSDSVVTQCFCSDKGVGIQTDWWSASGRTDGDIALFKSQGWVYIPNGSLWGLSQTPYIARNIAYTCKADGGIGGGTSESDGGSILSTATEKGEVLGLAATGDIWLLYAIFALAFLLLGTGSKLLKRSSNKS